MSKSAKKKVPAYRYKTGPKGGRYAPASYAKRYPNRVKRTLIATRG
jgi:hypothetical protein